METFHINFFFVERNIMKVQLKLKNEVFPNYLIDENGIIYDINGSIQKTYIHKGRPCFKNIPVHRYVVHSFIGYKEKMEIHHLNEDKFDNRLENLVYLTKAEHTKVHHIGKPRSLETRIKMSESQKGRKISDLHKKKLSESKKGRIWVNNCSINKMVYSNEIPEGFVKGRKYGLSCETKKKISESCKGQQSVNKGRIWVNNGVVNKMVYPNEIPEGFVKGMLRNV